MQVHNGFSFSHERLFLEVGDWGNTRTVIKDGLQKGCHLFLIIIVIKDDTNNL